MNAAAMSKWTDTTPSHPTGVKAYNGIPRIEGRLAYPAASHTLTRFMWQAPHASEVADLIQPFVAGDR